MSGIIYFVSGKQLEITEKEFRTIPTKLGGRGIKCANLSGNLVPLNSTTIELVEHIEEPEEESVSDQILREEARAAEPLLKEQNSQEDILSEGDKAAESEIEKPKKTQEDQLAEMTEKSNCKHEPEKMELYIQHTAKGIRYFPVCSFCGKRERYISESKITKGEYVGTVNEKWTDADIANSKPWIED